jgi:mercuric ion transport protein
MSKMEIENPPGKRAADQRKTLFAAGSVLGAMLASACCVGPLVLLTLGISGAWIGNLTAFEPYKPFFAVVAIAFIALGFRQVHLKSKPACDEGSYCARPESALMTKTALWLATVLVVLALTTNWWAPLFY